MMLSLPPSSEEPDVFVLLKINGKYRILAGYRSSYLGADSWRLSTPIEKTEEDDTTEECNWTAQTESGSVYYLRLKHSGYSSTSANIKRRIIEESTEVDYEFIEDSAKIELVMEDYSIHRTSHE